MSVEPVQSLPLSDTARKVWVLNKWKEDYRENFRGEEIVVPANEVKELLMPVLRANRFLGSAARVSSKENMRPDGSYPNVPKALYILELTTDEKAQTEGKTVGQLKEEKKQQESLKMCSVCGDAFPTEKGLALHVRRSHSEMVPNEEK